MFTFLHTFEPSPVLIAIGPLTIYYYGVMIVLGILVGIPLVMRLARRFAVESALVVDAAFWAILFGIVGARAYHIFLELPAYLAAPLSIFAVWNGGLAIHGGVLGGVASLIVYTKKNKIDFWALAASFAPALALAQGVGRFGNWFNQELYGLPTALPWGIPIAPENRLPEFYNATYFHPAFLYESILNISLAAFLVLLHRRAAKTGRPRPATIVFAYLLGYSLIRFGMEYIRIDPTPVVLGLRWPQVVSLALAAVSIIMINRFERKANSEDAPLAKTGS